MSWIRGLSWALVVLAPLVVMQWVLTLWVGWQGGGPTIYVYGVLVVLALAVLVPLGVWVSGERPSTTPAAIGASVALIGALVTGALTSGPVAVAGGLVLGSWLLAGWHVTDT